jgi:hypothetical protein
MFYTVDFHTKGVHGQPQPETQMHVVEYVIRWQGRYKCTATSYIALPWWPDHLMNQRTQTN